MQGVPQGVTIYERSNFVEHFSEIWFVGPGLTLPNCNPLHFVATQTVYLVIPLKLRVIEYAGVSAEDIYLSDIKGHVNPLARQ